MKTTGNYNLPLYEDNDLFDKEIINDTHKKIDKALSDVQDTLNSANSGGLQTIEEVMHSRGNFDSLPQRLDNFNSQLEDITKYKYNCITPEMFGAKGDGVTDDTVSIQNAINYAQENGAKLIFLKDYKTYLITNKLEITDYVYIDINHNTLKASGTMTDVFYVNQTNVNLNKMSYISNPIIDINNVKNCNGINLNEIHRIRIKRPIINNVNGGIAINVVNGSGAVVEHVLSNSTSENSILLKTSTADCIFRDFIGVNFKKAIIDGGSNKYIEFHPWLMNYIQGSTFATHINGAESEFINCYGDTYEHQFDMQSPTSLSVVSHHVWNNPAFYNLQDAYIFYYPEGKNSYSKYVKFTNCTFLGNSEKPNQLKLDNLEGKNYYTTQDDNRYNYVTDINDIIYTLTDTSKDSSYNDNLFVSVERYKNVINLSFKLKIVNVKQSIEILKLDDFFVNGVSNFSTGTIWYDDYGITVSPTCCIMRIMNNTIKAIMPYDWGQKTPQYISGSFTWNIG